MDITHKKIAIRDLIKGFNDNGDGGVVAYDGRLDVRPAYQREFVYKDKPRDAVIETVLEDFPLNTMYWAVCTEADGTERYEIIDGQQRTISLCLYAAEGYRMFSVGEDRRSFNDLTDGEREAFLDYELDVYQCRGDDRETLKWFEKINIAGAPLKRQELLNAMYHGPWLDDAKRFFSRQGCAAHDIGAHLMKCEANRQDYLAKALTWIVGSSDEQKIRDYMSTHRWDENADELTDYFTNVVEWVDGVFPEYSPLMRSVDWNALYVEFSGVDIPAPEVLDAEIEELLKADTNTIGNKSGIWPYVLTRNTKYLNLRSFSKDEKETAYQRQNDGECPNCPTDSTGGRPKYERHEMEADHIKPWSKGGRTTIDNCQMLCTPCNRAKSDKWAA